MGMGPKWTEAELQFMRDNWRKMSWLEIGEALGRAHHSVRTKAGELGLRKLPPKPREELRRAKSAAVSVPMAVHHRGPAHEAGEPVVTARTRITVAPMPRDRFDVDVAQPVVSSAECRDWARNVSETRQNGAGGANAVR